jgi:hypothetical protein
MSSPAPSLPDAWIARIFATMRATYGSAFDRAWACPEGENAEAHAAFMRGHWARTLGPFAANPDAIRHGLENLPPLPPTLPQFAALCAQRPDRPVPALPAPKADPERVRAALQPLREQATHSDPRAWAWRLKAREDGGERLGHYARTAYREALKAQLAAPGDAQ